MNATQSTLSTHSQAVHNDLWQQLEALRTERRNYAAGGGTSQARHKKIDAQMRRIALHMEALNED